MNFLNSLIFGKSSRTSPELNRQLNERNSDPLDMSQDNKTLLTQEQQNLSRTSRNSNSSSITEHHLYNSDRTSMNQSRNHHASAAVDYNHIRTESNSIPMDASKYMLHNGKWVPIDYVLVYTRYHSSHFLRRHRLTREHDEYRHFFQERLRHLGFIVTEERLTDEENDILNLRQAETAAPDTHDNNNEENTGRALARSLSTLQRHVSVRLQNISAHLKREPQDASVVTGENSLDVFTALNEDENIQLQDSIEETKDDDRHKSDGNRSKSRVKLPRPSESHGSVRDDDAVLTQDERYFVKIHAPFEVLLVLAEKTKVQLPFSENKAPLKPGLFDQGLPCQFTRLNPKEFPKPNNGVSYFTACYQKSLHYRFAEHFANVDQVFRPAVRSRLVYELLLRCPYRSPQSHMCAVEDFGAQLASTTSAEHEPTTVARKDQSPSQASHPSQNQTLQIEEVFTSSTRRSGMKETGIEVLLEEDVYEAAYPLHDQLIRESEAGDPETWNDRMKLLYRWAKFRNIFRVQPIQAIRDYYGERLAFYFAWLGWYNSLLILPSLLGIFVLLWGLLSVKYDRPTLDICNPTSTYLMCPKIDRQAYWFLNETCFNAKMSYVFDNSASVAFAIFISVFAVSVSFLWQRQEIRWQFEWDMTDIAEETETVRPDFERRVEKTIKNKLTDKIEPYVPRYKRCFYYMSSFSIVFFMVILVLAIIVGIVIYRLSVSAALNTIDRGMWIYRWKPIIVLGTAALINLIVILILQYFYEMIAIWLTNAELHRTDKTYEDSLTIKMFLFQFVNYYASIFYVALIKPLIIYKPTYLDRHSKALRLEECDVSGCVWELSIQLIIIMVGKQLISNIWEFYFSKLWNMCRKRIQFRDTVRQINERNAKMKRIELEKQRQSNASMVYKRSYEEDFLLQPFQLTTLFYEYLEIILQFGFITFFCLSFPLAPLFGLINNIFEIRIDALKVVKEFRRPVARRAIGIGTWNSILTIMAKVTVLSNAFLIAITSEYIPRQVYFWTVGNRSLNGFLNHTLAPFHSSDFPLTINRTLLECEFLELRHNDLSSKSGSFFSSFGNSYSQLPFNCSSPMAQQIKSQIDFSTCYYKDYRLDHTHNYARSYMFYYVMVARLAFVIIFEHFVYSILFLVRHLIPRVPRTVRAQLDRCRYLVQQMYWGAELYARNPCLIKKDENRVHADEQQEEQNQLRTLPTLMTSMQDSNLNRNISLDV